MCVTRCCWNLFLFEITWGRSLGGSRSEIRFGLERKEFAFPAFQSHFNDHWHRRVVNCVDT
jgi:hypothetical protein